MKTVIAPTTAAPSERLHGLDAVRAGALLLGVVVHASMAWLPDAQYFWPAHEDAHSPALNLAFYVPHLFRMVLFFLLAGFFARLVYQRHGWKHFVRNRLLRIGLPLVIAWPLTLAAIIFVGAWGAWLANNGVMPPTPPSPELSIHHFPLTHLWFLYLLLWCYVAALACNALPMRQPMHRLLDKLLPVLSGVAGPVLLALPPAIALFSQHDWIVWFGIPTPDQALLPNPSATVAFGLAFGLGWQLHRRSELLQRWAKSWPWHLALALVATLACLWIAGVQPVLAPAPHDARMLAYACAYAFAAWSWSFALIGAGLAFLSGHSPARRYLADASYWVYIVHLPLVMALQVAATRIDWPWFVEFPLLLAIAMALSLGSYQWLVRRTFIGRVLNGRRYPRAHAGDRAPS